MSLELLHQMLRDADSEILEAMRALAEAGNSEALHALVETRAKYASAIAHLVQARGQLGRSRRVLDALAVAEFEPS